MTVKIQAGRGMSGEIQSASLTFGTVRNMPVIVTTYSYCARSDQETAPVSDEVHSASLARSEVLRYSEKVLYTLRSGQALFQAKYSLLPSPEFQSETCREGIVRFVCLQNQSQMKTVCCSHLRYNPRHIGKLDQKLHTKFLWLNKKLSNLVYP